MEEMMASLLVRDLPLKLDQICIYSRDSFKAAKNFCRLFGLDESKIVYDGEHKADGWVTDKDRSGSWHLRLAYVYRGDLEIEFLQYVGGESFHSTLIEGETSHIGTHVDSVDSFMARNPAIAPLAIQVGQTKTHRYAYFDTVRSLGFRLKVIERLKKG